MNVRDMMTAPAPTVTPDTRVTEVARLILESGSDGVVVVDAQGNLQGLVTEDDLVAKHARVHAPRYLGILGGVLPIDTGRMREELRHVLAVTAGDIMSPDPVTVDPETSVEDAASIIIEAEAVPLVVMEAGRVVGVVSHSDVIRLLLVEESDDDASTSA
jgi:CBS domain-containing protein